MAITKEVAEPCIAAIAAVMAEVERLKKADNNTFAKYKFTSVDDFKDHIRPLLAKHGLTVRTDELSFEPVEVVSSESKKTLLARFQFAFQLVHISGAAEPAERSTVTLQYTGAQTTGAARSYAMKEWIKSRFLASSGDADPAEEADHHEQKTFTKTLPKAKGRAVYERLSGELRMLASKEALHAWIKTNASDLDTLPEDWQVLLRQEIQEKSQEFKANGNGNGKPKLAALPAEIEPNPKLRQQLADSALLANWEFQLKHATREEQSDIWAEVELWIEAGNHLPKGEFEKLQSLLKGA